MLLSTEDRLLLYCARTAIGEEEINRARELLSRSLDWERLLNAASIHGLAPLLFRNLKLLDAENIVPNSISMKLERAYQINVHRNRHLSSELAKILGAFQAAGITVMVLKGLVLAKTAYDDDGLRLMGDMDLLIREEDFGTARSVLLDLGYEPTSRLPELTPTRAVEYAHYFEQMRFRNGDGTLVEIHFRLFNMGVPKPEPMVWKSAVRTEFAGVGAMIPSLEYMLTHACVHANQHSYCMMRFFTDIDALLRKIHDEFDWEYFAAIVRERKLETSVYYTLCFAEELLGTRFPAEVLMKLKPGYLRAKLFEVAWGKKNVLRLRSSPKYEVTEAPVYYLLEMDGAKEKLKYLRMIVFPRSAWLSQRYSDTGFLKLHLKYFAGLSLLAIVALISPVLSGRRVASTLERKSKNSHV